MCLMPKPPKMSAPEPKLPRQPVRQSRPARFESAQGDGTGTQGRSGSRALRIKRQRSDPSASVSVPGIGSVGASLSIGAQVPGAN